MMGGERAAKAVLESGLDPVAFSQGKFVKTQGVKTFKDWARSSAAASLGIAPESELIKARRFENVLSGTEAAAKGDLFTSAATKSVISDVSTEVAPSPVDIVAQRKAQVTGAGLTADEQLRQLGKGITEEVASGLEATAKRIRDLPKELEAAGKKSWADEFADWMASTPMIGPTKP